MSADADDTVVRPKVGIDNVLHLPTVAPPAKKLPKVVNEAFDPLSLFPSKVKVPRAEQAYAIREVYKHFANGKKYVVLDAPPGTGKSLAAITLAKAFGRAYVTTLTKALQDQFVNDPDFTNCGLYPLKGRSAYVCERIGGTCEEGGRQLRGEHACVPCVYKTAREEALGSSIVVASYHSFLANVAPFAGEGAFRDLLVLDEAHAFERILMDTASISVRRADVPFAIEKLPDTINDVDYWAWCDNLAKFASERLQETTDADLAAKYEQFARMVQMAQWARKMHKYVLDRDEDGEGFSLRPVTVGALGHIFYSRADRILLMSGTILDFDTFCRGVGIPKEQAAYVTVPCVFPAKNRPIVVGNIDMTKKARGIVRDGKSWKQTAKNASWPKAANAAKVILNYHKNDKGLILAPSADLVYYILWALQRDAPELARRMIVALGSRRGERIDEHINSPYPTVLAAPGAWEGLDLAEDAGRFQIITSLPRPFLSVQTRARMDLEPSWYNYQTICKLVQGIGRTCRSATDKTNIYVLDRELRVELAKANTIVPQWVRDAIHYSQGS